MRRSFSRAVCRIAVFFLAGLGLLFASKAGDNNHYFRELAQQAKIELYSVSLRAPLFRLPSLEGGSFSNSDLKGRVILLSFWASWCATCKVEFPSLERLQATFDGKEFSVVGIAVSDTPDSIRRFLRMRPPPFPILLDTDKKVAEQYRAAGVPVAYLLDRDGRIIAAKTGEHRWDDASTVAVVRHLLAKGRM